MEVEGWWWSGSGCGGCRLFTKFSEQFLTSNFFETVVIKHKFHFSSNIFSF